MISLRFLGADSKTELSELHGVFATGSFIGLHPLLPIVWMRICFVGKSGITLGMSEWFNRSLVARGKHWGAGCWLGWRQMI